MNWATFSHLIFENKCLISPMLLLLILHLVMQISVLRKSILVSLETKNIRKWLEASTLKISVVMSRSENYFMFIWSISLYDLQELATQRVSETNSAQSNLCLRQTSDLNQEKSQKESDWKSDFQNFPCLGSLLKIKLKYKRVSCGKAFYKYL